MKKKITTVLSVVLILATVAALTGCSVADELDSTIAVPPETTETTTSPILRTEVEPITETPSETTPEITETETPTKNEDEPAVSQTGSPDQHASVEQTNPPVIVENGTTLDPEKIVPDMSPEAQLERFKADLALRQAGINDTNSYYDSLVKKRDDILSSVGGKRENLSKEAAEELKIIENRIKSVEFNGDVFLADPDFYSMENVFLNNIPSSLERCIKNQKGMKEGSSDWLAEQAYIEMYTTMIEMYEAGASMDDIYLYNFAQLNKMQGRE